MAVRRLIVLSLYLLGKTRGGEEAFAPVANGAGVRVRRLCSPLESRKCRPNPDRYQSIEAL
jgi:hypothetical protein